MAGVLNKKSRNPAEMAGGYFTTLCDINSLSFDVQVSASTFYKLGF